MFGWLEAERCSDARVAAKPAAVLPPWPCSHSHQDWPEDRHWLVTLWPVELFQMIPRGPAG